MKDIDKKYFVNIMENELEEVKIWEIENKLYKILLNSIHDISEKNENILKNNKDYGTYYLNSKMAIFNLYIRKNIMDNNIRYTLLLEFDHTSVDLVYLEFFNDVNDHVLDSFIDINLINEFNLDAFLI